MLNWKVVGPSVSSFFAITFVLCVGYGVVAISRSSDRRYPDAWDPRIEPLARFVEKERGAPFEHPVYVDFIDSSTFDESVSSPCVYATYAAPPCGPAHAVTHG